MHAEVQVPVGFKDRSGWGSNKPYCASMRLYYDRSVWTRVVEGYENITGLKGSITVQMDEIVPWDFFQWTKCAAV